VHKSWPCEHCAPSTWCPVLVRAATTACARGSTRALPRGNVRACVCQRPCVGAHASPHFPLPRCVTAPASALLRDLHVRAPAAGVKQALHIPVDAPAAAAAVDPELHLCLLLRTADGALTVAVSPAGGAGGAGAGLPPTPVPAGGLVQLEVRLAPGVAHTIVLTNTGASGEVVVAARFKGHGGGAGAGGGSVGGGAAAAASAAPGVSAAPDASAGGGSASST
jgi:hypothetical protein